MDTLTHALLGSLVVRASLPRTGRTGTVSKGTATWAGGLAAAFPDVDYLSFWIAPLSFLADWHRGPTHSLLMAPFWALLLGFLFARLFRVPSNWLNLAGICLLALLSHIASDLITAYGTQILWPLSDARPAFGITFVVDPLFSALVVGGLTISLLLSHSRTRARIGLLAVVAYLGFQLILQQQAMALGETFVEKQGLKNARVQALPQPLSPFNWSIIVSDGKRHALALVNLAYHEGSLRLAKRMGWLGSLWASYRPPDDLVWQTPSLFGDTEEKQQLAKAVWHQAAFARFRRFAKFPVLYRIDRTDAETCVWFTDLRYVLPTLTPPFRYGMCSDGEGWLLYRLRRFTHNVRHYLGEERL